MDKLTCPCGNAVTQIKRMGITLYKHEHDKQYCPPLTEDVGGNVVVVNIKKNLPDFYRHTKILSDLECMSRLGKNMTNREVKDLYFVKELLKHTGDKEGLKNVLSKYEKAIMRTPNSINTLIFRFGRDMEYLLGELGWITPGEKVYEKSLASISLGLANTRLDVIYKPNIDEDRIKDMVKNMRMSTFTREVEDDEVDPW